MSKNRNLWSETEDTILKDKVDELGLGDGLEFVSKHLARSYAACQSRYYNLKNKKTKVKTEGVVTSANSIEFMGFKVKDINIQLKERKITLSF